MRYPFFTGDYKLKMMNVSTPPSRLVLALATLCSGVLWYFGIDISGAYGFLVWIAPLPVLWISLQSSARTAFLSAFAAYFLGRLSWIPFLMVLMPIVPIILITVLPPVLFGAYVLLNRWIVLRSNSAWSVFAYPAIVASCEFLVFNNPTDGTAGSLAYSQSNYLPIIQIASVTGIWGIVFLISLMPAALISGWYFRDDRKKQLLAVSLAGAVLLGAMVFAALRLGEDRQNVEVPVGITAVSEELYTETSDPVSARQRIVEKYKEQISVLAGQGATYVLFPEKIFHVQERQKDSLTAVFQQAAVESNTTIIGGIAVRKEKSRLNLVEFVPPSGKVQEYQKRFHVKGFEGDFERGERVGFLQDTPMSAGLVICKDMDFPAWLREYRSVDLLFVPSWDFMQDGWLHSRMAIMRGVENGFTIVRAGRQGRLTVSDYRGRVVAETNVEKGQAGSLVAKAPVYHVETIYSKWGDWFGWVSIFFVTGFIVFIRFSNPVGRGV